MPEKICTAFDCEHIGSPSSIRSPRYHCGVSGCENHWRRCPKHQGGKNKKTRMVK